MTMTEQSEKLSSLLDDYQPDKDDQALNDLLADVNQRYTLRRYQLIGDTLRNELPQQLRVDFAADVMAQIEQEETYQSNAASPAKPENDKASGSEGLLSWLFKPVAGLAVAAAVAVITISTLQSPQGGLGENAQLANNGSEESRAKVEQLAQIPVLNNSAKLVSTTEQKSQLKDGMNWKIKRNEPEMQSKLNVYLINHNEYSNSMSGIIPQARVVGFDDHH